MRPHLRSRAQMLLPALVLPALVLPALMLPLLGHESIKQTTPLPRSMQMAPLPVLLPAPRRMVDTTGLLRPRHPRYYPRTCTLAISPRRCNTSINTGGSQIPARHRRSMTAKRLSWPSTASLPLALFVRTTGTAWAFLSVPHPRHQLGKS